MVDGASAFRVFRSVTLPLSVPGLVATFLIAGLRLERVPAGPCSSPARTPRRCPHRGRPERHPGPAVVAATSVLIQIMIIPVIAVAVALERVISRGLLVGAVKG